MRVCRWSLVVLATACSAASNAPPPGDASTADAPVTSDVRGPAPPLDNALCRRAAFGYSRIEVAPGQWLVEVMGLSMPTYRYTSMAYLGPGRYEPFPFPQAMTPLGERREWLLHTGPFSAVRLQIAMRDSLVDAPVGRVLRQDVDFTVNAAYLVASLLAAGASSEARTAQMPFDGTLTLTVVERNPATPLPRLELGGVFCESGDVLGLAANGASFVPPGWPDRRF